MDQWKASGSRFLLAAPVSTMDAPGLTLFFSGVNETFSAGSDLQPKVHHAPRGLSAGGGVDATDMV